MGFLLAAPMPCMYFVQRTTVVSDVFSKSSIPLSDKCIELSPRT